MSLAVPPPGAPADWLTRDERTRLTTRSFAAGLLLLTVHFAIYGATLVAAVAPLPLVVNLFAAVVNGLIIGMIFTIGHDACHGSYLPSRIGNKIVTRLCFVPALHAASLWDLDHNHGHHGRTNFKGRDLACAPMSKADYDAAPRWRRLLERIYRGPFGPFLNYSLDIWFARNFLRIPPGARTDWRRHRPDIMLTAACALLIPLGIGVLGTWLAPARSLWQILLVGWFLPFMVWNYTMGITAYLLHTHPQIPWFDNETVWNTYNGYVRGTAQVDVPINALPLWTALMRGHAAHHVMPAVPIYKLARAQGRLHARYGADRVRYELGFGVYGTILRSCKLFDFERMCWTDFEGNPTSEPIPLYGQHNPPVGRRPVGDLEASNLETGNLERGQLRQAGELGRF